ncbi:conserved hypothetical protein [Candidatus Accumulibacter aalborgensis]|uniref:Radical SAM core domain-containing protein n=1 Tax=Candidatus Accumulibacter aalborgensis TaxID=1860102 RepID=A0A1A8XJV6_9PROT|nr:glycosyltransferase [Candidatus Accumulibacter aalborgensis]SBT04228.1 conserved hypothetical protein [Candidatus Accumulibacter aalborgensis]
MTDITRPPSVEPIPIQAEHILHFSVIIPAYNAAEDIRHCLASVFVQDFDPAGYEVLLVDDCSTDATLDIASGIARGHGNLQVMSTLKNSGPGIARNIGVSQARGMWIIFLDSDDTLARNLFRNLKEFMDNQASDLDAIGYNWAFASADNGARLLPSAGRRDQNPLGLIKTDLLKQYLCLHMDGSVIYTAVRRELITQNHLCFADGYHEDVDYIFMVYWCARRVGYLDEVLYYKGWRPGSIVNTISRQHVQGFMRAWARIAAFIQTHDEGIFGSLHSFYRTGLVGAVATRAREIYRKAGSLDQATELYTELYECLHKEFGSIPIEAGEIPNTQYGQMTANFLTVLQGRNLSNLEKGAAISRFMGEAMDKSWSCIDLHHSLFLAPDQIRTCCKRFFLEGAMRGDVVLLNIPPDSPITITPESIRKAKQGLHHEINSGGKSPCEGCPFLEFKEWGSLDKLELRYLSFEYHSVCNLKCSYCSDIYFGGKQPHYDVKHLVNDLGECHALDNCSTVVWGGGEPVVDKDFDALLENMVRRLPHASQRVLTNSVKHNKTVQRLLAENRVSVTTSVDAGTETTYVKVRGMPSLNKAMANLRQYAEANSSQVTIKYIFTDDNRSLEEVRAFVALVTDYKLIDCNFQISCDFKHETLTLDTVVSMIVMYGLLIDAGCRLAYFDDLLRQRLSKGHAESAEVIQHTLKGLGLGHTLADKSAYESVAIWGAGWQSRYLIEKSAFFRDVRVAYFIDSRPSVIGKDFMGYGIFGPDTLLKTDIPVVISAVQNLPLIHQSFVTLGLDKSRLINKLIL